MSRTRDLYVKHKQLYRCSKDPFPRRTCRDIMEAYCKEIKSLAMIIICQLAKALRMDEKEMRDLFSDSMQSVRMNYYPPCPEPDRAIGLSPHSDADPLTILFQLNETEGLQVRKDDIWVPIKPLSKGGDDVVQVIG
ncbi:hypothetical protein RND71_033646 [Anisodus tanguticus]|uniref:Isopenicillin N synthase-like Fe(2+) 2OG dioxygenase domain-containing protein n=1 Tax=Anisodus tanguticus TaxID=243964 RepID=A0AAE1RAK8_9SOLA|nr:hypothetical protein RND71_033646 [Anisodus tanguticus]